MLNRNRGFTLVELLVVIGIIAVLISLLLPALNKAREQSNLVVCESNIRQQLLAQLNYAVDNGGYFAPHSEPYPDCDYWGPFLGITQSNGTIYGNYTLDQAIFGGGYLKSPYVLICPLLAAYNSDYYGNFYVDPAGEYGGVGGWGGTAAYRLSAYAWYTNWDLVEYSSLTKNYAPLKINYQNGETPWPSKLSEAKATAAMVAHYLDQNGLEPNHGGIGPNDTIPPAQFPVLNMPVGYGDGHVEIHLKNEILWRANCSNNIYY